jgi:hypothetical protein
MAGWAVDPDSSDSLRVHAYVDGKATAAYTADISRTDIDTAYEKGPLHGYDFRLNLAVGVHSVCVYAINVGEGTNTRIGCKTFDMGAAPRGGINSLVLNAGTARLVGWAIDDDLPTAPVSVQVNVDGAPASTSVANVPRADIGGANPGAGNNHGFDMSLPLAVGRHDVCVYVIDPGPGATNTKLECAPVTLATDPVGNVDKIVGGATSVTVAGWAVDTDTPTPIDVQVTVDGAAAATLHASGRRTDVGVLYPGTGYAHGFTASVPVAPGDHDVCINALNVGAGSDSQLGCAHVSVGVPPIGGINALTSVIGLQSRITGWAIDPDTTDPISVHVYVNGQVAGGLRADVNRADVGQLYPASGPTHGFDGVFALRPGANQVCVYAINVAAGANRSLGCKSLTLPSTAANPVGGALTVRVGSRSVTPYGWTADPDVPTTAIRTHVYVDGRPIQALTAGVARADVARIFPFYGAAHGYQTTLSVTPGRHSVCVYAINQGPGTANTTLGCRTVTVPS